jgi:uncharacterized spore protein YtfJ
METKPATDVSGSDPGWPSGRVVERVAERLASADARTIYGSPIERGGVTVIPVARVRYGFGGGAGRKQSLGEEGTGAGGGVVVTPVGFIEMRDGRVKFRRIRTTSPALTALGIGLGVWLAARVVRRALAAPR